MNIENETDRQRFYRERDLRTADYLDQDFPGRVPATIHAGNDACSTAAGQLALVALANQLARAHQNIRFSLAEPCAPLLIPTLCKGSSLGDELQRLMERIDPYGTFGIEGTTLTPADISIGIGVDCRKDLTWYLGCDRSNAELAKEPRPLGQGVAADLRGAGLAAVLGAAAAFKAALDVATVPAIVSAWNFAAGGAADSGPRDFPMIDVGRGLMIGGGAVAAGAVYWLMQWGNASPWVVVDGDIVKLHNTNRGLLFFPDDADWLRGEPIHKVACLHRYLGGVRPIAEWFDNTPVNEQEFDTVLVLANERAVRTLASQRNDPIQLQATTGRSWMSQLHRHIVGRDDCIRCRMADVKMPRFGCSEGDTGFSDQPDQPDAALPFLSAASGLMLVSALQRLQLGEIGEGKCNTWRWDFRSTRQIDSMGRHKCRRDCSIVLPSGARRKIAAKTRWADQPWLVRPGRAKTH